jgi:o-succinylbenzoate---CoA ligase
MTNKFFDFQSYINHFKDNPFILSEKLSYTYQDFGNAVNQAVYALKKNKVVSGDYVALIGEASFKYVVNLFALFQIGAVGVLVNPKFSQKKILELLTHIGCKKYLADRKLPRNFFDCSISMEKLNTSVIEDPLKKIMINQYATVLFTSGSSGKSKACLHSLANHYYSALGSNENIEIDENDRWLQVLPVFHVGGLAIIFRTFISGATVVIPQNKHDLANNLKKFDITHVSLVPTQLYRLLNISTSTGHYRNLKAVLLGGDKIPINLIRKAQEHILPIHTSYGATEMSSQITTTSPGESFEEPLSSGKLLNYCELKIGNHGEILVKGKTLFNGYLIKKSIVSEVDNDGWFNTGDLGQIIESDSLVVKGRMDNMFISGGENIYPEEIEQELNNIHEITEALIVGIEDVEYGMIPVAFIRTKNNQPPNVDEISKKLLITLPKFKIPKRYYPWPKQITPSLKPDRNQFISIAQNLSSGD